MTRVFRPGTRLGRYLIVERIGCGGMAELYLGRADGMGGFEKALALKVVHAHLVQQPAAVRMFLREARIAATLDHPNIVQVLDVGAFDGEHALVMEYVHGRDVGQILARLPEGQGLPVPCALRIFVDVCDGLAYAHAKSDSSGQPLGIVHRDVSPANVLVGFNGSVKLTDFGIAKISAHPSTTETGTLKGKFGYMSPEQSLGQSVDLRSDIFALGVLLYEMTTGHRTFPGENAFQIMNGVIEGEYVPPEALHAGYPGALSRIIARALQPDADDRYSSVAQMRAEVEAFARQAGVLGDRAALGGVMTSVFGEVPYPDVSAVLPIGQLTSPSLTLPSTFVSTAVERSRRRRRSVQAGAAVALALGVGGALGWYAASDARLPSEAGGASRGGRSEQAEAQVVVVPVAAGVEAEADESVLEAESEAGQRAGSPQLPSKAKARVPSEATGGSMGGSRDGRRSSKRRLPRRPGKKARNAKSGEASGEDLDSMFPKSMQ